MSARRVAMTERAAQFTFTALALSSLLVVLLIVVFTFTEAWPAFQHNGFGILGVEGKGGPDGLELDTDLQRAFDGYPTGTSYETLGLWPAIYGTFLFTIGATLLALPFSLLCAMFISEFAPRPDYLLAYENKQQSLRTG